MKVNVGLIGSKYLIDKLMVIGEDYPKLNLQPYIFEYTVETEEILLRIMNDIDIVVFSGPVPYRMVERIVKEENLPSYYIPFDEHTVLTMLLYLVSVEKKDLRRMSIDIPFKKYVTDVFDESNILMDQVYIVDYEKEFDKEYLFAHHNELWQQGKIDFAVTCRSNVYHMLTESGIPCYRLIPPAKSMRNLMDLVHLKGEAILLDLARFAVLNIGVNDGHNHDADALKLYQIVRDYAKMLGGSVTRTSDYISIYTDRKKLEEITLQFTHFPFMKKIKSILKMDVFIGIGLGWSNHDAEKHSLIALQEAFLKNNAIFLVNEVMEVKSLLDQSKYDHSLRTTDKDFLEIANKTNLSIQTLSKIKNYYIGTSKKGISSDELANGLNLTRRSAQRILKVLLETNLANIIGEEQPYLKGRPVPIYRILI
jgi:hypothetical protein